VTNDPCLTLYRLAAWINTPQYPEITPERQALLDAYALILEARTAMDPAKSTVERYARQRAWLIKTDPTVCPVELEGEGAPPVPEPLPGDAP
jgi:hypothetical protein